MSDDEGPDLIPSGPLPARESHRKPRRDRHRGPSRREIFLGAAATPWLHSQAQAGTGKSLKIAALATVFHKYSHAQHIVDRFLEGYGWNGAHHRPAMDLVSLYVDQVGKRDLSRERARRFPGMKLCRTAAEALTLGGSRLAVDGVLLIGEHGKYPENDRGQMLYPRYEFFQEIVKVFRASGRVAPVFNDKHLSWSWPWAKKMFDTARDLRFPLLAGSSLPVTWRIPAVDMPFGGEVREALCIGYGPVDNYDFHALETVQCMVERRKGGESGVKWVQAFRGENLWKAWADGLWPKDLIEAALARSHTLTPSNSGFVHDFPALADLKRLVKDPVAYRYQHADGLVSTVFLMTGLVKDFNFAAGLAAQNEPLSTQMYLPMPPDRASLASFFSPLCNKIETMFLTGVPPYPAERTLLTSGVLAAGIESLHRGLIRIETPHLAVPYQAPRESTFWRG